MVLGSTVRVGVLPSLLYEVEAAAEIQVVHPPRDGMGLLVIDLDKTIFDFQRAASPEQCKRPFTNEYGPTVGPWNHGPKGLPKNIIKDKIEKMRKVN